MRKRKQLAALGSVMAVIGGLLLAAAPATAASTEVAPMTLKACTPTAGVGSVHHLNPSKPQPVDENVNVYVGGDFTRAVGAELEGKLVVNGNAVLAGNARYDMGYVGGGSGIIPVEGADMVAVGGSITINGTSVMSVGSRTAADTLPLAGNVKAGGAITPLNRVEVLPGGTVTANLGRNTALGSPLDAWPDDNFSVLRDFATRNATGTAGTAAVVGGELVLTGDPSATRHLIEIPGSLLTGQSLALRLVNIDPTDIVVVKVTGPAADLRISDLFTGVSVTPVLMGAAEFGQRASRMLWEFPDATAVTFGGAQPPGSVLVPTAGSTTTVVGAGTNGRVWVAGDLTQNAAGGEFHAFPFLGDDDSTCGQPPAPRAVSLVSIGDYVWIDADGDGIQDAGEAPVSGATVRLLDAGGTQIATDVTDANGYYSFTDLTTSTGYTVVFPTTVTVAGKSYTLTSREASSIPNGSNADPATGRAPVTTPASGANLGTPNDADDPTIDAGYRPIVSIGDYLWIDADKDGVQDAAESPVPAGTRVRLLAADGTTVIATAATDANGYYVFTDLPGDADVIVEFPTSVTVGGLVYPLTSANAGGDDTKDSDANPSNGRVAVTTPASGRNLATPGDADDPTIDAGYTPNVVSIGDYVWIDSDRDGVQDAGEAPVAGATVKLLSADGLTIVKTTTTDASGFYVFSDLPKSTAFIVEFPTTVTRGGVTHVLTQPVQGADRAVDSNPARATGRAPVTTPADGDNRTGHGQTDDPTIDAGFVAPLVSIGDFVWIDTDRDGQQDAGEPAVSGVRVELRAADGVTVIDTDTTDADGYYSFTNLEPGTAYVVKFPTSVTWNGVVHTLTVPAQGATASDSNPAVATGLAPVTTPLAGANSGAPRQADDPTIDAGFVPTLVSVGDYVWLDADRDGIQDAGEKPVAGVVVRLLLPNGDEYARTTTDENGYYVFADLPNSTDFIVEFPTSVTVDGIVRSLTTPGVGDDRGVDSNPAVTTGRASVTTPVGGGNSREPGAADVPTIDAGYVTPLVSVGDFVWLDGNRNGVQDAGEKPLSGITVKLLDKDGALVRTTMTDKDGYYVFTDLPTETVFTIEFPTSVRVGGVDHALTPAGRGGDAARDSNAAPGTGRVTFTTPASGSNSAEHGKADDPTLDAGYAAPATAATGGLAVTGGAVPWLIIGLSLLLLTGGGLLVIRRRRRA
ncbi:MAG: choice-of-anchor A family protein [Microbacterium sp.]|nr:choice-of-anchor A family protein [Microbacterium sp.]